MPKHLTRDGEALVDIRIDGDTGEIRQLELVGRSQAGAGYELPAVQYAQIRRVPVEHRWTVLIDALAIVLDETALRFEGMQCAVDEIWARLGESRSKVLNCSGAKRVEIPDSGAGRCGLTVQPSLLK